MKQSIGHLRIVTVFDEGVDLSKESVHSTSIRNTLHRVFPDPFFFDRLDEERMEEVASQFQGMLPIFKWSKEGSILSIFFLARQRLNLAKFFYDMVNCWLIPGRKIDIPFFFSTEFKLPDLDAQAYFLAEMVVRLNPEADPDQIAHNLRIIETEIRLGMVSIYHASRILEVHRTPEKSAAIQEKIVELIQRRPDQIDYEIFGELQHFLVMSKDEFKRIRDPVHLSRLISCFYLFRKMVQKDIEASPQKRHVRLKLAAVNLDLPWGLKRVLGICVGLNFLKNNELFEERHFIKAIQNALPSSSKEVEDSFFVNEGAGDKIHVFYIEIEKENGSEFSLDEIGKIRMVLPDELKRGIEVALRPLFMPRNEEEIIRHIVTLAKELRFIRDLPQVILVFEQQGESDLLFNVILVRILFPKASSIAELFSQKETFLTYIPERIKRVGMLRKKYPKEATIFQVRFSSVPFLRDDHSLDLYRARQAIIEELHNVIGEVRDYTGGMIAKQLELLSALKKLIGEISRTDELLLENFFHALFPVEMRSFVAPEPLKILFLMWKELLINVEKRQAVKFEKEAVYVIGRENVFRTIDIFEGSEAQMLITKPETVEEKFLGYIYFSTDVEGRRVFLSMIERSLLDVE